MHPFDKTWPDGYSLSSVLGIDGNIILTDLPRPAVAVPANSISSVFLCQISNGSDSERHVLESWSLSLCEGGVRFHCF